MCYFCLLIFLLNLCPLFMICSSLFLTLVYQFFSLLFLFVVVVFVVVVVAAAVAVVAVVSVLKVVP